MIGPLRGYVRRLAADAGLSLIRQDDFVLAINELVVNTVRHSGGPGLLRAWEDDDTLVCEVRDGGHLEQPLLGRIRPQPGQIGGWGLWLVHQLCDLVQMRSSDAGSVVRVHMLRA